MLRNRDRLEPRQGLRNDPDLREQALMPLQTRENFGFQVPECQNPWKKSRAARAKDSHIDYEIGNGLWQREQVKTLPKWRVGVRFPSNFGTFSLNTRI